MYHIVKDVASLITMSSGKRRFNSGFPTGLTFQNTKFNTPKLGQLACFTSSRDIMNIAKYTGNTHGMFVADIGRKEGIFLGD